MMTSGPKLLQTAMSESMVLWQLGFVLVYIVHVTTEPHVSHVLNPVLKYEDHA